MCRLLLAGAVVLALAACSDKGADADGDGKISANEAKAEMADGTTTKMQPGEWETKITFSNIEGKSLPPQALEMMKTKMSEGMSTKSCLTKEQSDKPGSDIFGAPAEANCSFEELDRNEDRMKVAMTCKPVPNITVKSKMDGTFAKTSYAMNIEQSTEGQPMGLIKMTGKIEGKRIGDCPT